MNQVVRVGIGVAVRTKKGYVFLKRQGSFGAGLWSFPGGHLEFGETVIQCAVRETFEETGLVLEDAQKMPIFSEDKIEDRHYITLYVHGFAKGEPMIMEPHKASALTVIQRHEDLPLPVFPGTDFVWLNSFREYDVSAFIFFNQDYFDTNMT
jgi:8-oxo-dGTP diphosphatase